MGTDARLRWEKLRRPVGNLRQHPSHIRTHGRRPMMQWLWTMASTMERRQCLVRPTGLAGRCYSDTNSNGSPSEKTLRVSKKERVKLSKKNIDEKGARKDMSRQLKSMEEGMKERHAAEIAAWDAHAAAAAAEEAAEDNEIMEEEL